MTSAQKVVRMVFKRAAFRGRAGHLENFIDTQSGEAYNFVAAGHEALLRGLLCELNGAEPFAKTLNASGPARHRERTPTFVDAYSLLAEAYTLEATNFPGEWGEQPRGWRKQAARQAVWP